MFNWNDILIVGDSFCKDRAREYEWPQQLTCALTGQSYKKGRLPRGEGHGGASWWSARSTFKKEIEQQTVKLVVFCHTDSSRIPSDGNLPLNAQSRFGDNEFDGAVQGYYRHLYSNDFHTWAKLCWFEEADQLCKKYNIQAVHIHCFEDESNYMFSNGLTINDVWKNHAILTGHDPFYTDISNHFAPAINIVLGQNLAKLITQWDGAPGTVTGNLFDNSGFAIKGLQ